MPSRLPPLRRHARGDEDVGRRQLAGDRVAGHPAGKPDLVGQTMSLDPGGEGRAIRSVADEPARERDAALGQPAAGLDEVDLALDLVERPDGDDAQRSVSGRVASAGTRPGRRRSG